MESDALHIADSLSAAGVNFLAIDFDRTFISAHTGGRWTGSLEDLIPHIRPFTRALLKACHDKGIHVGIVTFSGQISLIQALLQKEFSFCANNIVIRGRDGSWDYAGTKGKLAYMASAAQELIHRTGADITPSTTLLLDDDSANVEIAIENDIRAVCYNIYDESRRPKGDEVAAIYGKYMTANELKRLKVGDNFEVLCTDGLNYYAEIKYLSQDGDCLIHFLRWGKEFDFYGPLSELYAAPLGKFSEGISASNTYPKELFLKDKPISKKRKTVSNSQSETVVDDHLEQDMATVNKASDTPVQDDATAAADEVMIITHAGSGVLFRPDGDKVAKSFGPHLSQREIARLQCGDRVEVLCADKVHYLVEIKSITDDGSMGHIHFLNWSSRWDYRGSLHQLYIAHKDQYSIHADKLSVSKHSIPRIKEKSDRSIALESSRRYPDDFFDVPKVSFRRNREGASNAGAAYALRAAPVVSCYQDEHEGDEGEESFQPSKIHKDGSSTRAAGELIGHHHHHHKRSVSSHSRKMAEAVDTKPVCLVSSSVLTEFTKQRENYLTTKLSEEDLFGIANESCILTQQLLEMLPIDSLCVADTAISHLEKHPDVIAMLRSISTVYECESNVSYMKASSSLSAENVDTTEATHEYASSAQRDSSIVDANSPENSINCECNEDMENQLYSYEQWKELLKAKQTIDHAIMLQLHYKHRSKFGSES